MKQMGMQQDEIDASNVIINKTDGSKIVINNPSVTKITMQGQETFQIAGEISKEAEEIGISEEDIKTVMEKTNCSEEEAKAALEKTGDLTDAILELS